MKLTMPLRPTIHVPVMLLFIFKASIAFADGGLVRLSEVVDGVEITIFTSPTPLSAGVVDISALAADAKTKAVLDDVRIEVVARPRDVPGPPLAREATHDLATNKLLRAATLELPQPGWWQIDVYVQGPGEPTKRISFEAEVAPPRPRWVTFWPWFTWPIAAVVLFGAHQWLVSRGSLVARIESYSLTRG